MTDVVVVIQPEVRTVEAGADQPIVVEVGVQGPPGRDGAPGAGYVHQQPSAASQWVINHNLGIRPAVAVIDTGGNEVDAEIVHMSTNQTVVNLTMPLAGFARLS